MALSLKCDRCSCELSGLDDAYLLRHDQVGAWSLTNLERTASELLSDGDNTILCEDCMSDFTDFIEGGKKSDT